MNFSVALPTVGLLALSNTFMLFAWYGHLKTLGGRPWYVAAIVSWAIALFEYLLQVPANRIGFTAFSLAQLKIIQEVVTLVCSSRSRCSTCGSRSSSITCGPAFAWPARSTSSSGARDAPRIEGHAAGITLKGRAA